MKNLLLTFCLITASMLSLHAQDFPEQMQPQRLVNDFVNLFSESEKASLEQQLRAFNDSTSTQIAVVSIASLEGYDIDDYAQRLAQKWGIGQQGKDNGILVLVKPKTLGERGEACISVGYGLEGVVPDVIASRIVRNEMIPYFKQNDYFSGVESAVKILMGLSKGEFTAEQYENDSEDASTYIIVIVVIVIVLVSVVTAIGGNGGSNPNISGRNGSPIFFGGLGGSHGSSSSWGSFSGGSGSFGGFGGGGFGGGGASGSW